MALLWGFAEATLFFIVPDLWASIAGRDKLHRGLIACLYCVAGAMAGGSILYFWGSLDPTGAMFVLEKTPAVSAEMITRVREDLNHFGEWAIIFGPLSGTPYKLYAAQAAPAGFPFFWFLLVSIPARLIRFVAVTTICHYALRGLKHLGVRAQPLTILLTSWTLVYVAFFLVMPN